MPPFHYVALNQEHKELSGVIEAPDEASARKKLNEIGLSVVSLKQFDAAHIAPQNEKNIIFEFEAFDANGKKIVGTIASDDALKAYERLFEGYNLNVIALFSGALPPAEKEQARSLGVSSLRKQYEKHSGSKKAKISEQENVSNANDSQRAELLGKVDFTVERIEIFLKEFGSELKPEERETIQSYVNQLIRIKDSTNLEHIKTTCQRMLDHIQKQELFIHEELRLKESAKLKVETQNLLDQLKHTGLNKDIDIIKMARNLKQKPAFRFFADVILKLFSAQNPEIQKIKDQLRVLNSHVWSYIKMLVLSKSKLLRSEAWTSIKTLFEEKKRLKAKIRTIKMEESKQHEQVKTGDSWKNAAIVLGWTLAFYLLSYMASYPLTVKKFDITVPKNFFFYFAPFTKFFTLFLFVAYCVVEIRNLWLADRPLWRYLTYLAGISGFLLITINLL